MSSKQKKIFILLLILAFIYFIVAIIPNNQGANDAHLLAITSQDEGFQYPFLLRMLTPGETLKETLTHIISYHHYIYGYPFYVVSALASLPLRLAWGNALADHTQLHLLILRQFVSVLPMLASILILVYLQTRFKSSWRSIGLFIILAFIPGIVRQNLTWWHPDALAILFGVLVFYFLDRDNLRFGKDYYFAAIACGLSAGTKLLGFFFFLVIAGYLVIGLYEKKIRIRRAFLIGFLFIAVLFLTLVLSNPLLLISQTRADILQTHFSHNESFRTGWENQDTYDRNPLTWLPVLERWYGGIFILAFALASLVVSCLRGRQRRLNVLILLLVLPLSIYLLAIIAVRPDHYWMPVFLPLYSAMLGLIDTDALKTYFERRFQVYSLQVGITLLAIAVLIGHIFINFQKTIPLYIRASNQQKLLLACDTNPVNNPGNKPVSLFADTWYAVEEYNLSTEPPFRKFYAVPGRDRIVAASETDGIIAWACQNQEMAVFRSNQKAADYKLSHPATEVTGPSGKVIVP